MLKQKLSNSKSIPLPIQHMLAASVGEIVACLVRVPTEVVKQRMQAGMTKSISETVSKCMEVDGIKGLYKGFGITIMREIPFSFIQFPIYEGMKNKIKQYVDRPLGPLESASCGSFSGAIAAAATTPLDVIKTRLMLGSDSNGIPYNGAIECTKRIYQEGLAAGGSNGVTKVFFSGVQPRVMWISIGGFVFFGAYEAAKDMFTF
jgi:solute carrier family 25 S-adenosylmethionine transporter 26